MKLFARDQIQRWDQSTIQNHYRNEKELIEHVANTCLDRILEYSFGEEFAIFCGTGNNGADGLALALRLQQESMRVHVILIGAPENGSGSFKHFLQTAIDHDITITFTVVATPAA